MFGDAAAGGEDLVALGVLLGGDVPQLLEQRHVHVGLDVARDARIPIPVPRTPDVGSLVDQPDALHTEFAQPGPDKKSAESGADNRDVNVIAQRAACEVWVAPGIIPEFSKSARDLDILRDAVRAQSPIPFKGVFLPQSIYIECHAVPSARVQLITVPGHL